MARPKQTKKTLVLLPTYNEAENIVQIIEALFKMSKKLSGRPFEILVLDDESPDGTSALVKELQKSWPGLHLSRGHKEGLGQAYKRGFRYGLRQGDYDTFIMMDADFSHDPEAIPSLLAQVDKGADYVIGSRYVNGGAISGDWPYRRRLNSRTANLIAKLFIGTNEVADMTGGFKAIRVSALQQIDLKRLRAGGYVFGVNLLYEFSRHGFAIREVPITFTNRRLGTSKMRFKDVAEFVFLTYRLNPNSRPRRFIRFGLVGASGVVVNLAVLTSLVNWVHLNVILADAVAIETSIISNFLLNHYYTFRAAYTSPASGVKDPLHTVLLKLVKYNLITLGGAAISFSIFVVLYKWVGVHYMLSNITATVLAMGWNYWMSVRVVWKIVDS